MDACAWPNGRACADALVREPDPVRAKYMRRLGDAYAAKGGAEKSEEVAECCNAAGPCGAQKKIGHADCPRMDDGYACLIGAELGHAGAHARACACDPGRAQIPVPGGTLACDGDRPVVRARAAEALETIACATCASPAACDAEMARVDADLAAFIRRVIVTRCALP